MYVTSSLCEIDSPRGFLASEVSLHSHSRYLIPSIFAK